jgi:TIR domain-containing protein
MEKIKIFISKSGNRGNIACLLISVFLKNRFPKEVDVSVSEDIELGAVWMEALRNKIVDAHYFIALVDEDFTASNWCNFEVGCFISNKDDGDIKKRLLPIKIEENASIGIFLLNQVQSFDETTIQALCQSIFRDSGERDYNKKAMPHSDIVEMISSFNTQLDRINNDGGNNFPNFHNRVSSYISRESRKGSIGEDEAEICKDYWSYADNVFIMEQLRDIANTLKQSKRHNLRDKGKWKNIWEDMATKQIRSLCNNLLKINARRIDIYDTNHITDFWMEQIMKRVATSIWTTNLPGTNGRKKQGSYLDPQAYAISENEVKIERIFVISEIDPIDCNNLIEVIGEQLSIEINIYVILLDAFNKCNLDSPDPATTLDFMIIDDQYVYKTLLDKNSKYIKELAFIDDDRELSKLKRIKNLIVKEYVNIKNVEEYKSFLKKNKIPVNIIS